MNDSGLLTLPESRINGYLPDHYSKGEAKAPSKLAFL
jgi:hypothetical protein